MKRVLYVYNPDTHEGVSPEELTRANDDLVVTAAHGVDDAIDRLATAGFDCVLSAYETPDTDGIGLLRCVRDREPDLPFVLLAYDGTERLASEAIAAGVTDYVPCGPGGDRPERIAARVGEAARDPASTPEANVEELTEATEDVLWLITADWEEVLFVSSGYADIWGQSEARLRADPAAFLDAVHPDDRDRAEQAVDRLTRGEPVEIELRVNPSADYQRRVLVQAEPIRGRDGSVDRIAGASRDVTERRARERRLEEEQRMVNSVFSAIPDVLYTFDTEGYLLRWNDQLEAETGYDAAEIEEMYVTDFVPADEAEKIGQSFQAIVEDRRSITVESAFERKDGERVPFEFTGAPLRDADGGLRGITGVGRNIADQKRQRRRFEAVFNNTFQFTGLMDPDGTLLEANQAAAEFAGGSRDELVGEKIWDVDWFHENETAQATVRRAVETARGGEFFRDQVTVQGDEREAVIDFSTRPVTDERGAVELIVPEGRDITRLSEREQQLRVANRFLRHNIRNELAIVQGCASTLSESDDTRVRSLGAAIRDAAAELNENAEMARSIHRLIEREPSPTVVDLPEQLGQAVSVVRDRYPHAEILVDAPSSLEVTSLSCVDEALAELLGIVLTNLGERATVEVVVTDAETVVVELTAADDLLSAVERDVLTGEIDVDQMRHAQGIGVWYVYWHSRYSGSEIAVADDRRSVRIHVPTA